VSRLFEALTCTGPPIGIALVIFYGLLQLDAPLYIATIAGAGFALGGTSLLTQHVRRLGT
jgi:hypothetical protein